MKYRELVSRFKHKYSIRVVAGVLTVALLGGGLGYSAYAQNGGPSLAAAEVKQEENAEDGNEKENSSKTDQQQEENDDQEAQEEQEILNEVLEGHADTQAQKEETVYVVADATGSSKSVIVSEWLKNPQGAGELRDETDLSEIENVKGDESYVENSDGTITWQAGGKDIYYQGTTNKKLPVEMKITYKLDGKEISPNELAGKSGKVTIRMDYVNHEKTKVTVGEKEEEVAVPFTAVSGMILSEDFTNVQVTNGKVISDGKNQVVVGIAMPGLSDSLKVEDEDFDTDIEIPEYVEMTADVENFSLNMTMTMVLSDILSGLQLDEGVDLSGLEDSIDTLLDASAQLVDGSDELSNGLGTLKSRMGEYASGVSSLKEGVENYTAGASQVNDGIAALKDGSGALITGAGSLSDGVEQIAQSFTAENGLLAGASALSEGAKKLEEGLNAAMTEEEAASVREQAEQAVTESFESGTREAIAKQASEQFESSILAGKEAIGQQLCDSELYATMVEAIYQQKIFEAYQAQKETVDTAIAGYAAAGQTVGITEIVEGAYQQQTGHSIRSEVEAAVASTLKENVAPQIVQGIASSGSSAMGESVSAACEEAAKQAAGAAAVAGAEGAKAQIADQVAKGGLVQGAGALSDGVSRLYDEGITPLKQGVEAMTQQLPNLTTGIDALAQGSAALVANNSALTEGARKLTDATGQLTDGVTKLQDGSGRLKDGIGEFDEKGVQKLSQIYHGDVEELMERADAILDAGKGYQTFTRKPQDISGSVKFMIRTEAIKED